MRICSAILYPLLPRSHLLPRFPVFACTGGDFFPSHLCVHLYAQLHSPHPCETHTVSQLHCESATGYRGIEVYTPFIQCYCFLPLQPPASQPKHNWTRAVEGREYVWGVGTACPHCVLCGDSSTLLACLSYLHSLPAESDGCACNSCGACQMRGHSTPVCL